LVGHVAGQNMCMHTSFLFFAHCVHRYDSKLKNAGVSIVAGRNSV